MKNIFRYLLVFCSFFVFLIHTAHAEESLVRITDNVYSYVNTKDASAANSFGANAGVIIGNKGIAVIDTLISAKKAEGFLQDIRKISNKPILYVVNTHYHLDHSFGNSVFSKLGATIVAHKNCSDEMRLKAAGALANTKDYGLTPDDMTGTEIAYPDITFTDGLRLSMGGVEIDVIYFAPSHSKGSVMVHVPSEKTVFTGDILFTDFHPYMADGNITGWRQTLDFLASLDADKIIPGHGPLSGKKDVADMKAYIIAFDRKANELTALDSAKLEDIVIEMKKNLPAKSQGEWIIGANIQGRYLNKKAELTEKRK